MSSTFWDHLHAFENYCFLWSCPKVSVFRHWTLIHMALRYPGVSILLVAILLIIQWYNMSIKLMFCLFLCPTKQSRFILQNPRLCLWWSKLTWLGVRVLIANCRTYKTLNFGERKETEWLHSSYSKRLVKESFDVAYRNSV